METYGWMILLFPLAGAITIALTWRVLLLAGARPDRHGGDRRRVRLLDPRLHRAAVARRGGAPGRRGRVGLRGLGRGGRAAVDPAGPAVDHDVPGGHRRLDADPPLLDGLHGVGPGLHALLRVPELLRLQHAAAGPGGELPAADRRLGVRRCGLVPADLLLVPPDDRDEGRHQGLRHQRGRRRRPRARHVLHLQARRDARLPDDLRARGRGVQPQRHATSWSAAACCSWVPSPSRPRCRCTPGCRTPWRARRRSPR